MRTSAIRFVVSVAAALLGGAFACVSLLLLYVVGKLYLAGHNIEPAWYDTVAGACVFGGALLAAVAIFFRRLKTGG